MISKRLIGIMLISILFMVGQAEAGYTDSVAQKLGRGVGNLIYALGEIPLQISNEMKGEDYVYAGVRGYFKGMVYAVGRLGVGAYETVTFLIPQDSIISDFNEA